MAELPKSFGGPGMAMSEYYNPDSGGPGEDYDEDDEENAAKVFIRLLQLNVSYKPNKKH